MKKYVVFLVLALALTLSACREPVEDNGMYTVLATSPLVGGDLDFDYYPGSESEPGGQITITAPEIEGHTFSEWRYSGEETTLSTDNPFTITVYEHNIYLVAIYVEDAPDNGNNANNGDSPD